MYKLPITYEDFNGNQRTEDFYFNLTKAELATMELSTSGGLETYIDRIIKEQDNKELIKVFQDVIGLAFGVKSDDGKYFDKSPEVLNRFKQTNAYSELFMMLLQDSDKASKFIEGIMPADLREEASKQAELKVLPGSAPEGIAAPVNP